MALVNNTTDSCQYDFTDDLYIRFPLLVVFIMCLATVGCVGNLISIVVYSSKRMQCPNSWFLVAIAICDCGVLVATVFLYSLEVLMDYLQDYNIYSLWFSYVKIIYTISHVFQVSTVYLTLAVTIERYFSLTYPDRCQQICNFQSVVFTILAVELIVFALNFTRYFELDVSVAPECEGRFGEFTLIQGVLLRDETYVVVYSLWLTNLMYMVVPFLTITTLNIMLIYRLAHPSQRMTCNMNVLAQPWHILMDYRVRRAKSRDATRVLLVIDLVFLVCNAPGLILVALERTMPDEWFAKYHTFYGFARDVCNVMTVTNSATNFVTYLAFGHEFRRTLCKLTSHFKRDLLVMISRRRRKLHRAASSMRGKRRRNSNGVVRSDGSAKFRDYQENAPLCNHWKDDGDCVNGQTDSDHCLRTSIL